MLARTLGIKIVLGSATPSLETWQNCVLGKYKVSYMRHRVNQIPLPEMVLINMKDQNNLDKNLPTWLSAPLFEAIHQTLENKMQVALFLNRRGSAHFVLCRSCGYTEECPNCDISLSFHRKTELLCHYCAYSKKFSLECSSCREGELAPVGAGTESIETDLTELFPDIKVARADRDEIQSRADLEDLIEKMETGETQILIGTQMIAKGLDFPKLNLVGIILADVGFHLPDFRATERSFQLIQQMSGRAGRSAGQGNSSKVMIQTYNPDHPALQFALKKDFEAFAAEEIKQREFLNYPPVGRLIGIRLQGTQLDQVQKAARLLSGRFEKVKSRFSDRLSDIECLGPVEAPIAKLRGNFRYQALVKGLSAQKIHQFVNYILEDEAWVPSTVRIIVDVDPIYLL
jgi:primosomal protein N' (replication factor Y)